MRARGREREKASERMIDEECRDMDSLVNTTRKMTCLHLLVDHLVRRLTCRLCFLWSSNHWQKKDRIIRLVVIKATTTMFRVHFYIPERDFDLRKSCYMYRHCAQTRTNLALIVACPDICLCSLCLVFSNLFPLYKTFNMNNYSKFLFIRK